MRCAGTAAGTDDYLLVRKPTPHMNRNTDHEKSVECTENDAALTRRSQQRIQGIRPGNEL